MSTMSTIKSTFLVPYSPTHWLKGLQCRDKAGHFPAYTDPSLSSFSLHQKGQEDTWALLPLVFGALRCVSAAIKCHFCSSQLLSENCWYKDWKTVPGSIAGKREADICFYSFTTNTEVYTWNTFNMQQLIHLILCTPSATKLIPAVKYRHLNTEDRDSGAESQLHAGGALVGTPINSVRRKIILGLIKDPNLVITHRQWLWTHTEAQ